MVLMKGVKINVKTGNQERVEEEAPLDFGVIISKPIDQEKLKQILINKGIITEASDIE